MGICKSHERCPSCAKMGKDRHQDNLGIYEDGSAYCFSCGYYRHGDGKTPKVLKSSMLPEKQPISLPFDVSNRLDLVHNEKLMEYLKKYNLLGTTAFENHLMWSEWHKRLIFPIFGADKELLAWQGRYFGADPKQPKWYSKGNLKDVFYIKKSKKDTLEKRVVLVEDIVSTIVHKNKARGDYDCVCLFGSTISETMILRLKLFGYKIVTIWLDYDKRKEAYEYQAKYVHLFDYVFVKSTQLDPKDYLI